METFTATARTTVKRLPKRASYDREVVHRILDDSFLCYVGFVVDGKPVVIPTNYGRKDDTVYLHGSAASRMLRTLEGGVEACVTVALVDGLVLARSAFHHSVNYRSVVMFGRMRVVTDAAEKWEALRVVTDHIVPGRWAEVREPNESEMKATLVLALELDECSAKVRTGMPVDDEEDHALPVWAGVLPIHTSYGPPLTDPLLRPGIEASAVVTEYRRPG